MKYILVILLSLLSFSVKAQQDTIKIPTPIAKQIVKDLVKCDSVKTELDLANQQIDLLNQKINLKDTIINQHIQKDIIYEQRIKNEQAKFIEQSKWINILRKDNKKIHTKLTFTKIISIAIISTLTYFYITK